jgi:hypothetical protein
MEQEILLKMDAAINVMQRYFEQGYSLSCAYSGGKEHLHPGVDAGSDLSREPLNDQPSHSVG